MSLTRRSTLLGASLALSLPTTAQDFSEAERALFKSHHLANVKPPATLRYRFSKQGTLEEAFTDTVTLKLSAQAGGGCCDASAEFLSGARRLALPEVPGAEGNPVLLYFLEHDIREMNRRTKGQAAYFRKRIRMAVYQSARARDLRLRFREREVAARQFTIAPYADDPQRERFASLASMRYAFTLSDAVPGAIVALSSRVDGANAGAPPLLAEELLLEGATSPPDS